MGRYPCRPLIPDFPGQVFLAKEMYLSDKVESSRTISSFIVPRWANQVGFSRWIIRSFPLHVFSPSLQPNMKVQEKLSVTITNNLKTHVNLYMVRSTGQLHYMGMLSPLEKNAKMNDCYVGYSFVAIQGETAFNNFQIRTSKVTEWCICLLYTSPSPRDS